ncbi:hypothetical protein KY284_034437 [Solanum tuberosum]|nr:hypothetical protein KY284_034437 [Solanum tuberosum]
MNHIKFSKKTVRTITNCDIQLKRDEDEYYHEYMHLKNAESASNVVLIHHSIVKGREAYIQIKRFNKASTITPPLESPNKDSKAYESLYQEISPKLLIILQTQFGEEKGRPRVNFNHFPSISSLKERAWRTANAPEGQQMTNPGQCRIANAPRGP